jgi:hypothetical protein
MQRNPDSPQYFATMGAGEELGPKPSPEALADHIGGQFDVLGRSDDPFPRPVLKVDDGTGSLRKPTQEENRRFRDRLSRAVAKGP